MRRANLAYSHEGFSLAKTRAVRRSYRMIQFYSFVPQDRSGRIRWTLEELGVPYERKTVDFRTDENMSPAYLAVNPMGRIPALVDGNLKMFESGAICLYLAEKHDKGLAPGAGSPRRPAFLQWSFFATAHLDHFGTEVNRIGRLESETEKKAANAELAEQFQPFGEALSAVLSRQAFLAEEFSVADILVAQDFYWIEDVLLPKFPVLVDYLKRMKARPAAQRAELFKD